jgi:hypothetical protein
MKIQTKYHYKGKLPKFKVLVAVEVFKDYTLVAIDEEEALQIAEERARHRSGVLTKRGYSLGDIEAISAEKV